MNASTPGRHVWQHSPVTNALNMSSPAKSDPDECTTALRHARCSKRRGITDIGTEIPTLVSVLVPVYNEESLVRRCLERVLSAQLPPGTDLEIIVVDDGSDDQSAAAVLNLQAHHPGRIHLARHRLNSGKGTALRTALGQATGEFCIIQDADLEYSPEDYPKL